MIDAEGVGRAGGRFLGVGVAAENLEDRLADCDRVDADLLDRERRRPPWSAYRRPSRRWRAVALTSATVASVLGSSKVASTNRPVFWPSTAVKFLVEPVTGRSVTVAVPVRVTVEPPTSVTLIVMV